jgi:hypothetical protein
MNITQASQTSTALAAVFFLSLGANVGSLGTSSADTSPVQVPAPPEQIPQRTASTASTSLLQIRQVQYAQPLTSETQFLEYNFGVSWQTSLLAALEADQFLREALGDLQTVELLEAFEAKAAEFIDENGVIGISVLELRLLRAGDLSTEPFARRFIRALGSPRGLAVDHVAMQLLIMQLNSTSGGRRSAAASALGVFRNDQVLAALEQRRQVENNRFVLATLDAHIRAFRPDGLSSSKAV